MLEVDVLCRPLLGALILSNTGMKDRVEAKGQGAASKWESCGARTGQGGEKHEAAEQRSPEPEDEYRATMPMTEPEQAMVQVFFVGGSNTGSLSTRSPYDR